jgi:hypothetical protein
MNTGKRPQDSIEIETSETSPSCRVGIEATMGESQNAYLAATTVKPQTIREEPQAAPTPMATHSDSDSDSN